jgi:hypothetical protein
MGKLTEKKIFRWLKEMADEDCYWDISGPKLRKRIELMERYGWQVDVTRGMSTAQFLLWKRVKYKKKIRNVGFGIRWFNNVYDINFHSDFSTNDFLHMYGRSVCPACGRIGWLNPEHETCVSCRPIKCQVCGSEKAHYIRGWFEMCKYLGLDSMKPICPDCYTQATGRFIDKINELKYQNENEWVRYQGGRYKVKIKAKPIEGQTETLLYAFKEKPTRKEVKELIADLDPGYVKIDVSVEDLGPLH